MPRWRLVLKETPVFRPSRPGQPTPDLHLASRYEKQSRKTTIATTATATAAAKVVRIARRRRPRPAPLGLGTLFVVVWWGMGEWGGCTSDAPQPSVRLPPFPHQHDARTHARTQDLHDSIRICCCRPRGSGPVSREHGLFLGRARRYYFLGANWRCKASTSSCVRGVLPQYTGLTTAAAEVVVVLGSWGRRKRLVTPPCFLPSFLASCVFPWALAQGREYKARR